MSVDSGILKRVLAASAKRRLYLSHALRQMARPDRMIATHEVCAVVEDGELVEDYPADPRGHSCLILGFGHDGRPIHVVCSPKEDYLAIITAYLPDEQAWTDGFRVRRST